MLPLAVSLGDPAGVGPELIVAAWAARQLSALHPFVVLGGAGLLAEAARMRGLDIAIAVVATPAEAAAVFAHALPVIAIGDMGYAPGAPDRHSATLALASLTEATRLAVTSAACGVVTGPIAKSRLAEVGFAHPGQTEFVAEACGIAETNAVMMLAGPNLRTVPITVHNALAAVPGLLTPDLIISRAAITAAALTRDFGIAAASSSPPSPRYRPGASPPPARTRPMRCSPPAPGWAMMSPSACTTIRR